MIPANGHEELAPRLQRVENRLDIHELVARYAIACDDKDFDALAACLADDYEFNSVAGHSVGKKAAIAYYRERLCGYGMTFHIPHAVVLEKLEPTYASGIVSSHAEMEIDHSLFIIGFRYYDQYVRQDSRWYFRSREVKAFYAMPASQLTETLSADRVRWPGQEPEKAPLPESLDSWREAFAGSPVGPDPVL